MLEKFDLDGRVALITGSIKGLGFEIAQLMAMAGARVCLNGTSEERIHHAIKRLGLNASSACFDMTDEALAAATIERIFSESGRLDILVNNVGVRMRASLADFSSAELREMLNSHIVAAYALSKIAAPLMARGDTGGLST